MHSHIAAVVAGGQRDAVHPAEAGWSAQEIWPAHSTGRWRNSPGVTRAEWQAGNEVWQVEGAELHLQLSF